MHVIVTGATGWVGSAVVQELVGAGHQVVGLARSDDKAAALAATGAPVLRATLDDLDALHRAASVADAVIHTAFNHDFSKFAENAEQDRRAIETLGSALEASDRLLLVTSGLAWLAPGRAATEADVPGPGYPRKSEAAARALAARGVRAATVRLAPSVHGLGDHGFIPILIGLARAKGVSAYLGEGLNRWAGVHRSDAARLYRLVLEQGATEPVYHAVADEGVPFREIAEVIGRRLGVPAEPRGREHFGWFADFAGVDMSASSERTRARLGWEPTGPDLLTDIDQPGYYTG
jgi:nucleoside-diphosphate-sugar epimerase